MKLIAVAALLVLTVGSTVCAAPDEQKPGKDLGYPVGKAARRSWLDDESIRVGSFTHQAEIPGFYNGKPNVLQRADKPMPLPIAANEPDYRWDIDQARGLSVADYLARQRIMGLIIVKDGVVQVERKPFCCCPRGGFHATWHGAAVMALPQEAPGHS